jgi:hypothetical protein
MTFFSPKFDNFVKVLFIRHSREGGNPCRGSGVSPEKKRQDAASTGFPPSRE